MRSDSWQRLLALENRDAVCNWHEQLHGRTLNVRRAQEITSAAKQAREFFRNASASNDSVRPLLTFYGVAGLSRSTLLLLRRSGGEETLAGAHGLETVGWSNVLSGELASGLAAVDSLQIRTRIGLFSDFLTETANRMCMHVNSAAVDWRLSYEEPPLGRVLTFGDLLLRLPDLRGEYERMARPVGYATVNTMSFSQESGFSARVSLKQFEQFKESYSNLGYSVAASTDWYDVTCDADSFGRTPPQFMHTYLAKTFGKIPSLHIVKPFERDERYSQLAVTYMISYCMGMLARYFPTHWTTFMTGGRGDSLWPAINLAQRYVDVSFPELIVEFIYDAVSVARNADTGA